MDNHFCGGHAVAPDHPSANFAAHFQSDLKKILISKTSNIPFHFIFDEINLKQYS